MGLLPVVKPVEFRFGLLPRNRALLGDLSQRTPHGFKIMPVLYCFQQGQILNRNDLSQGFVVLLQEEPLYLFDLFEAVERIPGALCWL